MTGHFEQTGESEKSSSFRYSVEPGYTGIRLDQYLALQMPFFSRSQHTCSIRDGFVTVNGSPVKPGVRLKEGDEVHGHIPCKTLTDIDAQEIDFPVLFEDAYLLVISKPPNLVVHPGSGNCDNTLVNGLVHHCVTIAEVGDPVRPGIVHRLDKDTSGIMVIAKTDAVHRYLVEAFKAREVEKKYYALVLGIMKESEGRLSAAIGRHPVNRKKMAVREASGRHAVSNWSVVKTFQGRYSLVKIGIETGRTHQIRVHMAYLGHPIAGDTMYGQSPVVPLFPRQMLHSSALSFNHPEDGRKLKITAPLWPDMEGVLNQLGDTSEDL